MTSKRGTFIEGATDLRNTLDLAETYRGSFIRDANARASQVSRWSESLYSLMQPTEDSADELAPTPPYYVTQAQCADESPNELAPSPLGYLYEGHDSRDPSGIDPSTSTTISFTLSFSLIRADQNNSGVPVPKSSKATHRKPNHAA